MRLSFAVFAATAAVVSASVPSLTPDNFDEMTDGKTVFIKFFAPWCGHCKKMAPDWEKLSEEWEGNDVGFIAEVDCTADGKPLCDANGVRGFPTLKFGDPSSLEDYQGGRSYDDLAKFAKENLKPICSPAKLELCEAEQKAEIEKLLETSVEELDERIAVEEKKLEDAEENFKSEVQKLQNAYQQLTEEKEKKISEVKKGGLGLMKSVKSFKTKAAKDEL